MNSILRINFSCAPRVATGAMSAEVSGNFGGSDFTVTRVNFWNGSNYGASIRRVDLIDGSNGNKQTAYPGSMSPHSCTSVNVNFTTVNRNLRVVAYEWVGGFSDYCGGSPGMNLLIRDNP